MILAGPDAAKSDYQVLFWIGVLAGNGAFFWFFVWPWIDYFFWSPLTSAFEWYWFLWRQHRLAASRQKIEEFIRLADRLQAAREGREKRLPPLRSRVRS
jgi:hypothetical protein